MNHEPELIIKDENEFTCGACGVRFDQAGKILPSQKPPKPRLDARGMPISKTP